MTVASANICNVLAMRSNELIEGVNVVDAHGSTVGTSKIAARRVRKSDLVTISLSLNKAACKSRLGISCFTNSHVFAVGHF